LLFYFYTIFFMDYIYFIILYTVWDFYCAFFTVHPLIFYYRWIVQNFIFFQFGSQIVFRWFSHIWVIDFEFLWRGEIGREETKMKNMTKHKWHTISFEKDALWSSNLNNHTNYIILIPRNSTPFGYKSLFLLFFDPWLREDREIKITGFWW
jgi:hypothetical protein